MYWEGEKECISREPLKQLQLERLQAAVLRVYMNVPFYRKKFDEAGIDPDSFRSLEDLSKLPFTSKDDLRMSYPYGMLAVPLREVVRVQTSSGTTGMPTAVGYTRNDIKNWSNLAARILTAGGVTQNDIVQIAFDYGLGEAGDDAGQVCRPRGDRRRCLHPDSFRTHGVPEPCQTEVTGDAYSTRKSR